METLSGMRHRLQAGHCAGPATQDLQSETRLSHICAFAGLAGYGSQVTMTMALRRVKAAPATAMSYLSVVWGIVAGLAIFHVRNTCTPYGSILFAPFFRCA